MILIRKCMSLFLQYFMPTGRYGVFLIVICFFLPACFPDTSALCARYARSISPVDSLSALLETSAPDTGRVNILNALAYELRKSDPGKARQYWQEAVRLSRRLGWATGLADCKITEGLLHTAAEDWDTGRKHYLEALEMYTKLGDIDGMADAALKVGITHGVQSDYPLALEYFMKSLEAGRRTGDRKRISDNYNNIGHCHKYMGDYEKALEYYEKSMAISRELGDSAGVAMMHNHLAIIYDYQGNYRLALDHYFHSLRLNERLGIKVEAGAAYGNIGIIYYYLEDYEKALENQMKNLHIMQEVKDKRGIAIALYNIGNVYEKQGKYAGALEHFREGLRLHRETGDKQGMVAGYLNSGLVLERQGRTAEATRIYEKGLALATDIGYRKGIAEICINMGKILCRTGNRQEALEMLNRGLRISEELGYPELIRSSAGALSTLYAELGNYRAAYRYLSLFREMNDSVANAANIKKITRMEMQYAFDKEQQEAEFKRARERLAHREELKRQKIMRNAFTAGFVLVAMMGFFILRGYLHKKKANQLLAEQKEEIQTINDKLTESLDEKEVLLREIHHRVKNNLQIISSLLSLQTQNMKDKSIRDAVKTGQSRVKSMALIHQTLYQSDHLAGINFQDYLVKLTDFLSETYRSGDVRTTVEARDALLDIECAIPVGLIVNELVTNAYKYAFEGRKNGEVQIRLLKQGANGWLLAVADDGKGLPGNIDPGKTSSLGLRLVHILSRQLKGTPRFRNNNGTVFELAFKTEQP